jgi:hypothetical protein
MEKKNFETESSEVFKRKIFGRETAITTILCEKAQNSSN